MLAVGIAWGEEGVHALEIPEPRIGQPDEVLVRVKEAGLDDTDFNMIRHRLQDIAQGRNEMALGDIGKINARFDGLLTEMITHRYRLEDFQQAFDGGDPKHIKTVIEVEA